MANFEPDEEMDLTPSYERTKEYGLYVNNIPHELNQEGLTQLFENYGNVIAILHPYKSNWAFVTYEKYQEAERAINELNDTPPLYLKVQLRREEEKKVLPESMLRSNDLRYSNKTFIQTVGRGRPLAPTARVPGIVPECSYTPENDLLYSVPMDSYTYNPYDPPDPYSDSNTLWTRGVKTITADGKRHVSLGRGYTLYEIPYPPVGFDDSLRSVYAKRNGLYVNGENLMECKIGHCKRCLTVTKMRCEKCQEFYCSRECQVIDWPLHKTECQEIPGLIEAVDSTLLLPRDMKKQTGHENHPPKLKLRRPKIPPQEDKVKCSDSPGVENKEKLTPRSPESQQLKTETKLKDNQKLIDEYDTQQRSQSSQNSTNNNQMPYQNTAYNKRNSSNFQMASSNNQTGYSSHGSISSISSQNGEKQDNGKFASRKHTFDKNDIPKSQLANHTTDTRKDTAKRPESEILSNENVLKKMNQIEENIAFRKDTFLVKTKFTEVEIIIVEGNNEFWVQKVEDKEKLTGMMLTIQDIAYKENAVAEPKIGNMYAVQYETLWHRAILTSLKPLRVHFIDYGNTEIVKAEDIRDLIDFQEVEPFARKIRVSDNDTDKCRNFNVGDTVFVKTLSIDRGRVITVKIQREKNEEKENTVDSTNDMNSYRKTNIPDKVTKGKHPGALKNNTVRDETVTKVQSIVELLSNKQLGMMQLHTQFSSNRYGVTIVSKELEADFEKIFFEMPEECNNLEPHPNFRPGVGDLICGQRVTDNDWVRGNVLSVNPELQIAVIDEARTAVVQKILPCPPIFSKICAFSAIFHLIDCKNKLELEETYTFEVTNTGDSVEINVLNDDQSINGKGIVKEWKPLPEQKGIQYTQLKNGAEVCITAYKNQYVLYARPLERGNIESYIKLSQTVAKHAVSARNLEEPPVIGQMVMAQFSDKNYYRAIVAKVDGTKAGISYVDFGNLGYSEWKEFKELPDDLKQLRSCTARITLKDVPTEMPMTKEVNDFLESLVALETPLSCVFDGEPFKDGVQLKLKNGESVNEKIKNLLMPPHLKELSKEEDNTCYMVSDLETAELGDVGTIQKVLILCKMPGENQRYVMCPFDQQLITHVMEIMPSKISDYCKNTEMYIPRDNELCLVLYEDGWYRAVCLCRNETPTTALVFFVDYGNIESAAHNNIRKMIADFMTPCALGSICTIVNSFPPNRNDYPPEIEGKINQVLALNNCIQVKIVEATGGGYYDIEVPQVQNILKEEGLL